MSDYGLNGKMSPEGLLAKLKTGHLTSAWPEVVKRVEQNELRTYDTLIALKSGIEHVIRNYEQAIKHEEDIPYWTKAKTEALHTLDQLEDYRIPIVSYNGISLSKK
jgi:hypothetical protein